jgi:oligopeptidase A
MKRARTFRAANAHMRQLGFAIVDLLLHTRYSPQRDGDPVEYTRLLLQEFVPAPLPPEHAMIAAFTRFRDNGIFSREVDGEFREKILGKGDSQDPTELYRGFIGRDPDPQALLERSGLV